MIHQKWWPCLGLPRSIRPEKVNTSQMKEGSARSGGIPGKKALAPTAWLWPHFELSRTTGPLNSNAVQARRLWLKNKQNEKPKPLLAKEERVENKKGMGEKRSSWLTVCSTLKIRWRNPTDNGFFQIHVLTWLSPVTPPSEFGWPRQDIVEHGDGAPRGWRLVSFLQPLDFPPFSHPNKHEGYVNTVICRSRGCWGQVEKTGYDKANERDGNVFKAPCPRGD